MRRITHLVVLGAFLVYVSGCYRMREVPARDIEELSGAELVTIVTKDLVYYELRHVQVRHPYIAGQLPQQADQPIETIKIHFDDIQKIEIREQNTGLTVLAVAAGIAGGACLLYALVVAIILLTKESCPFVYSFDGDNFELEGELYSGAVFKMIERSDYLKLHHLIPTEGKCLLKISNQAHETQYTDRLSLLVVDHPQETSVIADRDGRILVLSNPQLPISAVDFGGNDVLEAVSDIDSLFWITNPLEKDPNESGDLRDGVVLRFEIPDSVDKVQLAVRIGNTYWADYIFGTYMALHGNLIDEFYEKGAEDLSSRRTVERFMRCNGLAMNVNMLVDETWKDLGYFYPTGPIAMQDDILEFEKPALSTGPLTIRLEVGSFFWMIDYAATDYVEDPPVIVRELPPAEAFDQDGSDIRELLLKSDDQYYIMPEVLDHAVITYSTPPDEPGACRTYIIRSEGYYTIHREKGRMPDFFAFVGIKQGSEGFLQYSLKEFWRLWRSQRVTHPE